MRLLLLAACLGALLLVPGAGAHRDPCHFRHACPSDHHTYDWRGLSCTSYAEERLASDTRVVAYGGRRYWCHGSASPAAVAAPASSVRLGRVTKRSGCRVRGPLPDPACSPGAVLRGVTAAQVCTSGWASAHRDVPGSEKAAVYAAYGIASHVRGSYEVDHIVSLELGGSNDVANLFPEAAAPRPGFHEKDRLENLLHDRVCAGKVALRTVQRAIARNWVALYASAFG
ncbi:MAG TPA: hypothetical protein VIU86_01695 [Gaiellaceae bacterium]